MGCEMKSYRTFVADPISADERHPVGRLLMTRPMSNAAKGLSDVVSAEGLAEARNVYYVEAANIVDFLQQTMPQGLVDALFAELARRKASVIRLTQESIDKRDNPERTHDIIP